MTETVPRKQFPIDRWLNVSIIFFAFVAALYQVSSTFADADLWGHVQCGLYFLQHGVLDKDPYSYMTTGSRWVDHSWLFEELMALAYLSGKSVGLCLAKLMVALCVFGALLWQQIRRGVSPVFVACSLLLAALASAPGFASFRPHLSTYLSFVLLSLTLDTAERQSIKWLWSLPVLFALWANLHGGFTAGLIMFWLWGGARVLQTAFARGNLLAALKCADSKVVLATMFASAAATLLNPYGVGLHKMLLETLSVPRPEITEWRALPLLSFEGLLYGVVLALAVTVIWLRRKTVTWAAAVAVAFLAVIPFSAERHLPLFVFSTLVLLSAPMAETFSATQRPTEQTAGESDCAPLAVNSSPAPGGAPASANAPATGANGRAASANALPAPLKWLMLVCCTIGSLIMAGATIPRLSGVVAGPTVMPKAAVSLLRQSGVSGNLATHFNWGEYCIWHLAPRLKVSMDGRRETVYSNDAYEVNLRFCGGGDGWDDLLKKYPTDLVLIGKDIPGYVLMERAAPDWQRIYDDQVAALYVRKGSKLADSLTSFLATKPKLDTVSAASTSAFP